MAHTVCKRHNLRPFLLYLFLCEKATVSALFEWVIPPTNRLGSSVSVGERLHVPGFSRFRCLVWPTLFSYRPHPLLLRGFLCCVQLSFDSVIAVCNLWHPYNPPSNFITYYIPHHRLFHLYRPSTSILGIAELSVTISTPLQWHDMTWHR